MGKLATQYKGDVLPGKRKKNPRATKLLREGRKSEYYRLRVPSRLINESGYRNCKYIRYADDFVVGVLGPRSTAVEIRDKIQVFLRDELKIQLNLEKSKITHISKGIDFLGYTFSRRQLFVKQSYSGRIVKRKMSVPTLDVNMKRVVSRLAEANLCDGSGNPTPAFRFLRLPQSETNMKANFILNGLSEWWSIAGNRKQAIARAAYIVRYSIAKVYAAKFKLKTVSAVFKSGGNDLSKPIGNRAKSVVGGDERDTPQGTNMVLKGVLFDRYHKIPKPKPNKLKPDWKPEYLGVLETNKSDEELAKVIW